MKISLNPFQESAPSFSEKCAQHKTYSDTRSVLESARESSDPGILSKITSSIAFAAKWTWTQLRWITSKVFFCFDSCKFELSRIDSFKTSLEKMDTLIHDFPLKYKELKSLPFKRWWKGNFSQLDPEVQKYLKTQYIAHIAPNHTNDKQQWAQARFKDHSDNATTFVVELGKVMHKGSFLDHEKLIPDFLKETKKYIEFEIKNMSISSN